VPEVAAPEPVVQAAPAALDIDLDLSNAAPVPLACSLDDPDCEACQ
jgi:ribonucleoside-diphosphate reductase alpha chain